MLDNLIRQNSLGFWTPTLRNAGYAMPRDFQNYRQSLGSHGEVRVFEGIPQVWQCVPRIWTDFHEGIYCGSTDTHGPATLP